MMEPTDKNTFTVPATPEVVALHRQEVDLAYQEALLQATETAQIDVENIDTRRVEFGAATVVAAHEASPTEPTYFDPADPEQLQKCAKAVMHWRRLALDHSTQGDFTRTA